MERYPMFMIGRLNILFMVTVPNVIYTFNAIFDKLILKFMWKCKDTGKPKPFSK